MALLTPDSAPALGRRFLFLLVVFGACLGLDRLSLVQMSLFQLARGDAANPVLNALVYIGLYGLGVFSTAALLLHPWTWLRWLAGFAVALLSAVHTGYAAVNGEGFGHHEAALLWSESQFAFAALQFFGPQFVVGVLLTFGLWLLLGWSGSRLAFRRGGLAWLVFPVASVASCIWMAGVTFGKVYQFPAHLRVIALMEWSYSHKLPSYDERSEVRFAPSTPPFTDHIIFVMDESISGHWLGINGASPDTTPFLTSAGDQIFNYGIASAISNLSSSSNLLLQAGLRVEDLPDRDLRGLRDANIFDYMRAAGFLVGLIDAQSYSTRPPNLMTQFDVERLDTYVQFRQLNPGLSAHAVDGATIPRLEAILDASARSFTYVLKTGAHFPYAEKVPPERRSDRSDWDASPAVQAYMAAVQWSTDDYLAALSKRIEATGKEVLVVYTADHGQSLDEPDLDASRRVSPHATEREPPSAQASVPLVLLAFGEKTRAAVEARYDERLIGRVSAFEIYPTLLEAAGYARGDLVGSAPSLFDTEADRGPRTFVSGNVFARAGGFYVLNEGRPTRVGVVCHLNPFVPPAPRTILPGVTRSRTGNPADRTAAPQPARIQ